jgi:maltose-binding protein MalE
MSSFICKFLLNQGYIKKIPLNPPLQKGEAFGMPGFIEMLPLFYKKRAAYVAALSSNPLTQRTVKGIFIHITSS